MTMTTADDGYDLYDAVVVQVHVAELLRHWLAMECLVVDAHTLREPGVGVYMCIYIYVSHMICMCTYM